MIDASRGSKRRLSDSDEKGRITLRQTVLNMSICKLQKDQGRKEPPLFRCVVIANTVRMIEKEMNHEAQFDYPDNCFPPLSSSIAEYPSHFPTSFPTTTSTSLEILKADPFAVVGDSNKQNLVFRCTDVPNDIKAHTNFISESIDLAKSNRFGAIGDRRNYKDRDSKTYDSLADMPVPSLGWDGFSCAFDCASFEFVRQESKLPSIDIALHDFLLSDTFSTALQLPLSRSSNDWRFVHTSCASEYDRKRSDSFFEDLDQIMQVLVGI